MHKQCDNDGSVLCKIANIRYYLPNICLLVVLRVDPDTKVVLVICHFAVVVNRSLIGNYS